MSAWAQQIIAALIGGGLVALGMVIGAWLPGRRP